MPRPTDYVAADRRRQRRLIQLVEAGPPVEIDEEAATILRASPSSHLSRLGLSLTVDYGSGRLRTLLHGSDIVGTFRFGHRARTLDVVVQPKVGVADVARMIRVGSGLSQSQEELAYAFAAKGEVAGFFALYVSRTIGAYLASAQPRRFEMVYDANARSPRGKLHLSRYATQNIPRGKNTTMPCTFSTVTSDREPTRVMLYVVRQLLAFAGSGTQAERARIEHACVSALQLLRGVTFKVFTSRTVEEVLASSGGEEKGVLQLCQMIVSGLSATPAFAAPTQAFSFQLAMPKLFERYVGALWTTAGRGLGLRAPEARRFPVPGIGTHVALDGLLLGHHTCVLETKYKLLQSAGDYSVLDAGVRNADLYQAVAYASLRRVMADVVYLVYPRVGEGGPVEEVFSTQAFGQGSRPIDVRVALVSLTASTESMISAWRRHLLSRMEVVHEYD